MTDPRRRTARTARFAVAAVAALALAGCSDDPEPEQGSRPVGADGSPTASATATPGDDASADSPGPADSGVELLDAGSEPRRVLELTVGQGHSERSSAQLRLTMDLGSGKMTVPVAIPWTTTVTAADGTTVTADVVYGKPTLGPGDVPRGAEAVAGPALDLVAGTTAHVVHGRDGVPRSTDLDLGDDAPDLVARLLDNIASQAFATSVPFPGEEVGTGARWRAETTVQVGGATMVVTSTYELTELTDDGYTVEVEVEQEATPGPAAGGGEIVESTASGSGTITGRPDRISPVDADTRLRGSSTVSIGGQEVTVSYRGTMRLLGH
ncbi:hypothetical protein L615_004600000230 [Nocardioides sp. J9]|uniref:hypothetical protein n=1 Tax=Nocardioides sp. J9 TaxID=935844 RepID=UPI0011ACC09D|nr:hypothetical protein [Nocardioides sp. J9]TWG95928.1 hypothetical protein L615_004600000230 [Nocardioides sp. J9]